MRAARQTELALERGLCDITPLGHARFGGSLMPRMKGLALLSGKTGDLGTIAVGHYGDLIGVAGDPLKDVSVLQSVAVVIKGGDVVKQAAAH
jgi:hypothetical protein